MSFHNTRFPTAISRAAHGGPERRTDVVVLGSGAEERNARWAIRAAPLTPAGVKSLNDLYAVIAFRERRAACTASLAIPDWKRPPRTHHRPDQCWRRRRHHRPFQLAKTYGSAFNPWTRDIEKPVAGTILVAVDGVVQTPAVAYTADPATGLVFFLAGHVPAAGHAVTAGFEFDVPVRFDTDKLEIDIQGFRHGAIPSIPIVEIRL
jgi:uncharacterized protein (TIGR02217 family)